MSNVPRTPHGSITSVMDFSMKWTGFIGEGATEQKEGQSEGWDLLSCWTSLRWSHCGFGPQPSAVGLKISWAILDFVDIAQVWNRLRQRRFFGNPCRFVTRRYLTFSPCVSKASSESCGLGMGVIRVLLNLIKSFWGFYYRCAHSMDRSPGIPEMRVVELGVLCMLLDSL